jgi:arylsulfatase A-like enzyme
MSAPARFLLLLAVSLLIQVPSGTAAPATAAASPNIVVFIVDDMGLMDTSLPFLGDDSGQATKHPLNDFYRTPAMERLAAQGLRFGQFYANSVCSPTRVTLMTGQSSARHHTTQWVKSESKNTGPLGPEDWNWEGPDKNSTTLPRLLQKSGYRTIHCGKAHFGPDHHDGENPLNIGFDVNIAGCSYGQPGSYYGTENFGHGNPKRSRRAVPGLEKYHGQDIYLTEALTLEINAEISRAVQDQQPFFAYMSHYAVHTPFEPDPRFIKHYADSDKSKAARTYASMIEGMDKSLGDMMDHLTKLGVAEDTLILFLGDNGSDAPLGPVHGYSSSAPLRGKKGTHYEGGMRVPFIAAWAKPSASSAVQQQFPITKGFLNTEFATICDVFPTLLDVAGVAVPQGHTVDGRSLREPFAGKRGAHPQQFLMHFPHSHRSSYFTVYRNADWKLIYHYHPKDGKRYELFNLASDPYENNECAANQPEELARLVNEMKTALGKANAQFPISPEDRKPVSIKAP